MPVGTLKKKKTQQCSEGNIKCQFVTSELQQERNMEIKEDLGDSALPPFSSVLWVFIWYASFVLRAGLAVGLDPHGYGNPDFCWLSVHDTLIWSFAGPISVVVLVGSTVRGESFLHLWVRSETVGETHETFFIIRWTLWSSSWPRRLPAVAGRGPWRSQEPCKGFFVLLAFCVGEVCSY